MNDIIWTERDTLRSHLIHVVIRLNSFTIMFKKMLKYLLVEIRDWFFAITGIISVICIPKLVGGSWLLAIPIFVAFIVLYLIAVFASSRILKENNKN